MSRYVEIEWEDNLKHCQEQWAREAERAKTLVLTAEEAVVRLKWMYEVAEGEGQTSAEDVVALRMAIDALTTKKPPD